MKLKPCPFCGCEFLHHKAEEIALGLYLVVCEDCDASGPLEHTEDAAMEVWNTRNRGDGQ